MPRFSPPFGVRTNLKRAIAVCLGAAVLAASLATCAGNGHGDGARAGSDRTGRDRAGSQVRVQTTPGQTRTVPLEVVERGGQTMAFVPVRIHGNGPFLFAVDTGASSSTVDDDIARRLHLPKVERHQRLSGVAGSTEVSVVALRQWTAGDVALAETHAAAVDLDTFGRNSGVQGLLGSDVLSKYGQVTIDYQDEVLRLPG